MDALPVHTDRQFALQGHKVQREFLCESMRELVNMVKSRAPDRHS